jgi:hypothetical protein
LCYFLSVSILADTVGLVAADIVDILDSMAVADIVGLMGMMRIGPIEVVGIGQTEVSIEIVAM